jgi:hypothetical protein
MLYSIKHASMLFTATAFKNNWEIVENIENG